MPFLLADVVLHVDEAGPAAPDLDAQAAPELVLAVDLERLPPLAGLELDALLLQPLPVSEGCC